MNVAAVTFDGDGCAVTVVETSQHGQIESVLCETISGCTRDAMLDRVKALLEWHHVSKVAIEHPSEPRTPNQEMGTLPAAYELAWLMGRDRTIQVTRIAPHWRTTLGRGAQGQRKAASALAAEAFGKSWRGSSDETNAPICGALLVAVYLRPVGMAPMTEAARLVTTPPRRRNA